jgi:hypothetical protein
MHVNSLTYCFLVVLGFGLRASLLLGRYSTTPLVFLGIFAFHQENTQHIFPTFIYLLFYVSTLSLREKKIFSQSQIICYLIRFIFYSYLTHVSHNLIGIRCFANFKEKM